jgi:hypothetical protein
MKRHRTRHPDPISDLNPTVPAEFARVVNRLMEKNPARRYPGAAAARDALRPWADPHSLPDDPHADQTEAEVVQELERSLTDPNSFFETVPAAVFPDRGRKRQRREPEEGSDPGVRQGIPPWLILLPAGLVVMCLAGLGTALALYLLKAR